MATAVDGDGHGRDPTRSSSSKRIDELGVEPHVDHFCAQHEALEGIERIPTELRA